MAAKKVSDGAMLKAPVRASGRREKSSDFIYEDGNYGNTMLRGFEEAWRNDRFCDVTLIAGQSRVRAHKLVLSSLSNYFRAMFECGMAERDKDEIELPGVSSDMLERLVAYGYTGKIRITGDTVQDILMSANFLGIVSVCDGCFSYMVAHMDDENCIAVLQLAEQLAQLPLKSSALSYAAQKFASVCKTREFLGLPLKLLEELLLSDKLCYIRKSVDPKPRTHELAIAQEVLRYVDHQAASRLPELPRLLLTLRLGLLNEKDLQALTRHKLLKKSPEAVAVLTRVIEAKKSKGFHLPIPRKCTLKIEWTTKLGCGCQDMRDATKFDDSRADNGHLMITGMKIWIRRWDARPIWGGFEVFYNNGTAVLHGSPDGYESYEFHLEEGEFICAMDASSGWFVDQLTFRTSQGRVLGPYGGPGGGRRDVNHSAHKAGAPEQGFLMAVKGKVVEAQSSPAVCELSFGWRYYLP